MKSEAKRSNKVARANAFKKYDSLNLHSRTAITIFKLFEIWFPWGPQCILLVCPKMDRFETHLYLPDTRKISSATCSPGYGPLIDFICKDIQLNQKNLFWKVDHSEIYDIWSRQKYDPYCGMRKGGLGLYGSCFGPSIALES
eukprot:Gregarina_sp_Poly_1__3754@NODE_2111_length_2668_cov_27_119185_g1361_i0_p2_GENE_NODE_2111_length_2668_cov_27_119185_g1361_i0NODE_2111_length_2668_cov_27_119185_g1361_i0_p2_ORF_typecomplete_len142_score13_83_NODE_2111_length_2668_cov_27_119185_g1361_i015111936